MRTFFQMLSLAVVATTGCAARSQETTTPRRFDCNGESVVATGGTLTVREANGSQVTLARYLRDDRGDHFATPTGEGFVVPRDRRADAVKMAGGQAHDVCMAEAGYTDALQRFMRGADHRTVAHDLALDEGDARQLIRRALQRLNARYYQDR